MNWEQLLSGMRTGKTTPPLHTERSEFERDWDRIVFSPAFRRLQNKTQVFPLPGPVFVHNRLTHSLEVASVGRSLAREVAVRLTKERPGCDDLFGHLPPIVAAACLAHDIGNPPFGHSGERAIRHFFVNGPGRKLLDSLTPSQAADLTNYDGNANTFRLLAHTFYGRRQGGFALTCATLAATVKYPCSAEQSANGRSKFGYFQQDAETFAWLMAQLGIEPLEPGRYPRHPLVYLVEAADDICYQACDLEDAVRLGIVTCDQAQRLFRDIYNDNDDLERLRNIDDVLRKVTDPHEQLAYLRTCFVGRLVARAAETFVENEELILKGRFDGTLLERLPYTERNAFDNIKYFALNNIYHHQSVAQIELSGFQIIGTLVGKFVEAIRHSDQYYSGLVLPFIPAQFIPEEDATNYDIALAALDTVAGMTDLYALSLFRKMTGMEAHI